jgi:hypothetical protein
MDTCPTYHFDITSSTEDSKLLCCYCGKKLTKKDLQRRREVIQIVDGYFYSYIDFFR